jgi:hypothetical protein
LGLVAGILKDEAVYGVERSAAEAEVPPDGEGERGWLAASTLEWP